MPCLVLALAAHVIAGDGDSEVELCVGVGGLVGQDSEPRSAIGIANTQVDGGPIANIGAGGAPGAGVLDADTLVVDVVLGRGRGALPEVVRLLVGAGQWVGAARLGVERDGLGLGTCEQTLADVTLREVRWNVVVGSPG